MAYSLTWLPETLKSAGLKVAEMPGWLDRGRGDMGAVRGVMCHHTVGSRNGNMPSLGVLTNGRMQRNGRYLNGPLAQLGLGRDGTYYVIGAGRANHAGEGAWRRIATGNSSFIGIEAENSGTADDPWPDVQMDAYARGAAAILKRVGAPADMCCGHKEFALPKGRKPDPLFDMNSFRDRVGAIMAGTAIVRPLVPAADSRNRPTLRRGARGDLVRAVQAQVGAVVDGVFGPLTEARLRAYQRAKDLVADGIVGPRTWAVMEPD